MPEPRQNDNGPAPSARGEDREPWWLARGRDLATFWGVGLAGLGVSLVLGSGWARVALWAVAIVFLAAGIAAAARMERVDWLLPWLRVSAPMWVAGVAAYVLLRVWPGSSGLVISMAVVLAAGVSWAVATWRGLQVADVAAGRDQELAKLRTERDLLRGKLDKAERQQEEAQPEPVPAEQPPHPSDIPPETPADAVPVLWVLSAAEQNLDRLRAACEAVSRRLRGSSPPFSVTFVDDELSGGQALDQEWAVIVLTLATPAGWLEPHQTSMIQRVRQKRVGLVATHDAAHPTLSRLSTELLCAEPPKKHFHRWIRVRPSGERTGIVPLLTRDFGPFSPDEEWEVFEARTHGPCEVILHAEDDDAGRRVGRYCAWAMDGEAFRVFYLMLGHQMEVYEQPDIQRLLYRAIRWAAWETEG